VWCVQDMKVASSCWSGTSRMLPTMHGGTPTTGTTQAAPDHARLGSQKEAMPMTAWKGTTGQWWDEAQE
jgi:hypothetical protein